MAEWRALLDRRCDEAALDIDRRDLVARELVEHLQDRFEDLTRDGRSAGEAARLVAGEVPSVDAIRRLAAKRRAPAPPAPQPPAPIPPPVRTAWLADLARDARYAIRVLLKAPAFTAASVATLALCVAANVAVFAIVDVVLFKALDVPTADRLVHLGNVYPGAGATAATVGNSGVPDYFDRIAAVPAFDEHALFDTGGLTVGQDPAERLIGMTATPSLFRMLGVAPALGRGLQPEDGEVGREQKVVLSHALWQRMFGGDPSAVGRTLAIGSIPYEIVGVMPASFRFYRDEVVLWRPAAFTAEDKADDRRHSNNWTYVGRLRPGATVAQAQAQVDALNAANLERFPTLKRVLLDARFRTLATPAADVLVADVKRPLQWLWAGVACVLLIGLVNLTSLTLARATVREGELATRTALGADTPRLNRQLVTEHVVLAIGGGLVGAALGVTAVRAVPALTQFAPEGRTIGVAPVVWAYAAALTLLVGAVLGIAAARAGRTNEPAAALRTEGRGRTPSAAARRLRQSLVVAQVALACVLLVGAGVLLSTFRRLVAIDTGLRSSVVSASVSLPRGLYATDDVRTAFFGRLLDAVRTLPGVRAAGATTIIPFGDSSSDSVVWPADRPPSPGESVLSPDQSTASPGYFEAMGISVVSGRVFDGTDRHDSPPVVVIDELLARRFWPNQDAVGRDIAQPQSPEALSNPTPENLRTLRVVGVVREVKRHALVTPSDLAGVYYLPLAQNVPTGATIAVDATGDPEALGAALRRTVTAIDSRLPLFDVRTIQQRIDASLTARRATTTLALLFAGIALALSAVGLYGVLAFVVARRTREIGIRMALGGSVAAIASLVVRESVLVVGSGILIGVVAAAWLGRAISSQLADVTGLEPTVVAAAVGLLALAAVAATVGPLRRALRVDPATTLAAE